MLRLALLRFRPLALVALLAALGVFAAARPAAASNPLTTYVVPKRVDLEPNDDTATRVAIHGAFFQLTSAANFSYSDPKCGVMYFQCVAGQEAMCRMQWKELRAAISPTSITCSGFGNWNVLSTAAVRVEGEPLGAPDAWDLGMGIGLGSFVDNKCPVALRLSCPVVVDGGVAPAHDAAVQIDAPTQPAGTDGSTAPPPTGTGGTTGAAGAAGTTGAAGTAGAAGSDGKPQLAKQGGGCALAGSARATAPLAAISVLALGSLVFIARARRRRR